MQICSGGDRDCWNNTVQLVDGSSIDLTRRERPELIHDEHGRPVALINGAQFGVVPGNPGDQTFTLVQPVRVKLDDSSAPLLLGRPLWASDGPAAQYIFLRKSFELTAAPAHAVPLEITAQPTCTLHPRNSHHNCNYPGTFLTYRLWCRVQPGRCWQHA